MDTYCWGWAPEGLATRRQLAALGLRPGGQEACAQIVWRARSRRPRMAYLYRVAAAAPKRRPSSGQLAALAAAMRVRRTCTDCGTDAGYCLPISWGRRCLDCHDTTVQAAQALRGVA